MDAGVSCRFEVVDAHCKWTDAHSVYTCQKAKEQGCKFFLWDEDAKPREEAAVLNNSTSEPRQPHHLIQPAPSTRSDGLPSVATSPQRNTPLPPYSSHGPAPAPNVPRKRKLPWEREDAGQAEAKADDSSTDEDADPFGLTGEEEKLLSQATNSAQAERQDSGGTSALPPETPGKAQKISHGLPTPGTTPQTHKSGIAATGASHRDSTYPDTPTPSRFHDPPADTSTTNPEAVSSLPAKILNLLDLFNVKANSPLATAVHALLDAETRKTQGLVRGRDAARAAVAEREARIAELSARVGALETEAESARAVIKHLRERG